MFMFFLMRRTPNQSEAGANEEENFIYVIAQDIKDKS